MEQVNLYLKNLCQAKAKSNTYAEQYLKQHKHHNFKSTNMYHYFDAKENNFEKLNDTLIANLNIFKQDLDDDLSKTLNLYYNNIDGTYSISKTHIYFII